MEGVQRMKGVTFLKRTLMMAVLAIFAFALAACSNSDDKADKVSGKGASSDNKTEENATVEITDAHGKVTVPVNPKKVVALDNRTFETLADWGIKLAAAPKDVMPADSPYVKDDSVQNIGNHREPNLEVIAAADPDLVIVGQRFARFYEDIKKLVPNAAVIDLNIDVSEEAATPGDNLVNGFKDVTTTLGKIFDKKEEADKLIADFEKSIEDAKAAYNGEDKVMSVIVSGGEIGYAAPKYGRLWGPLYEILGLKPSLEVDGSSSNHQGDDISVEAIAESNPDWLFVLDRDAAISSTEEAVPAKDVIENAPALQNTTAITKKQIVYAPKDTYTNESIQTFIEIFESIAKAFTSAK